MILGKLVDWLTTPELRDQFMVNVGLTGQLASSKPNPIALYTIKGGLGGKTSLCITTGRVYRMVLLREANLIDEYVLMSSL